MAYWRWRLCTRRMMVPVKKTRSSSLRTFCRQLKFDRVTRAFVRSRGEEEKEKERIACRASLRDYCSQSRSQTKWERCMMGRSWQLRPPVKRRSCGCKSIQAPGKKNSKKGRKNLPLCLKLRLWSNVKCFHVNHCSTLNSLYRFCFCLDNNKETNW